MKKTLLTLAIIISSLAGVTAQQANNLITKIDVEPRGDQVAVSFTINVDKKTVKSNNTLTLTPSLVNGSEATVLYPILIVGDRAAISTDRHEMSTGVRLMPINATMVRKRGSVRYENIFPYEKWMEGATLSLEGVTSGCCNTSKPLHIVLAENLVIAPTKVVVAKLIVKPVKIVKGSTTGELMAEKYPFVMDISKFTGNFEEERGFAVYFNVGKTEVDPYFMGNDKILSQTIDAIKTIESSTDSKVVRIDIVGFASPEGGVAVNDLLSQKRSNAFKGYIISRTSLDYNTINVQSGSEDWSGLRDLVTASNMEYKNEVLSIIDNTPVWDSTRKIGRESTLMSIHNGKPYRYMAKTFFPQLRNAAYIRVYYKDK